MKKNTSKYIIISILLLVILVFVFFKFNKQQKIPVLNSFKKTEQNNAPESSNISYTHPTLGFSINYPANKYSISLLPEEGEGEMLLVQTKNSGTLGQIFISEFPEDQKLTVELIAKEFPEKKIVKGKKVLIGGVEAFSFESEEEGIGKTWEIIFSFNGQIYQGMSILENRENFEAVLSTFEWEK